MDVVNACPLLVPRDVQGTVYKGQLSNQQFDIAIRLRKPGVVRGAEIDCEWALSQLLTGYKDVIKQESQLSSEEKASKEKSCGSYYNQVIERLEELGWHRVVHIDGSFRRLDLSVSDGGGRQHILHIRLPKEFPIRPGVCVAELPETFEISWKAETRLCDIVKQLESALLTYQDFWTNMEDIDQNAWILEPEKPSYSAKYRRIALGQSASIHIDVDPGHPRHVPRCHFLGADHVTAELRESFNSNIHKWNGGRLLRTNLEDLLEITFPKPNQVQNETLRMECGICYAYRLEDELPDHVCDDSRCAQPFHHTCLYQWLRAIPDCRQSFNLLFGECPYCNMPITVKIPMS